jgi:hypothetical protein
MIAIKAGPVNPIGILSVSIGQVTGTSVANQRIRLQQTGSLTFGSGGTAPTPGKWVQADAVALATAHCNDTSQSGSTFTDLVDDVWNVINGYIWVPYIPSRPPVIAAGGGFRVSLDTVPTSIVTNMTVTFEEI